ncbi:MAG: hypothetical protein P1U34_03550 [Coxiellaceae bacterium]|nr:hypothetical protein [Coxiellaceae bacterium]
MRREDEIERARQRDGLLRRPLDSVMPASGSRKLPPIRVPKKGALASAIDSPALTDTVASSVEFPETSSPKSDEHRGAVPLDHVDVVSLCRDFSQSRSQEDKRAVIAKMIELNDRINIADYCFEYGKGRLLAKIILFADKLGEDGKAYANYLVSQFNATFDVSEKTIDNINCCMKFQKPLEGSFTTSSEPDHVFLSKMRKYYNIAIMSLMQKIDESPENSITVSAALIKASSSLAGPQQAGLIKHLLTHDPELTVVSYCLKQNDPALLENVIRYAKSNGIQSEHIQAVIKKLEDEFDSSDKSIDDIKFLAQSLDAIKEEYSAVDGAAFRMKYSVQDLRLLYRHKIRLAIDRLAATEDPESRARIEREIQLEYRDGVKALGITSDIGYAGRWQRAPMVARVHVTNIGREDMVVPPIARGSHGPVSNISKTTLALAQSRSHITHQFLEGLTPDEAFDFVEGQMKFHLQNIGVGGTEFSTPYFSDVIEADGYYQPKAHSFAMNMLGDYARSRLVTPERRDKLLRMEFELRADTEKDVMEHRVTYSMMDRLKAGEMVSLGSGWDEADGGHAIQIMFKQVAGKTYMIYANRGDRKDGVEPGMHIYEVGFASALEDPNILQNIVANRAGRAWIEQQEDPLRTGIAGSLGLHKIAYVEKTDQKTGNCTLAAANHSIQAWLMFDWLEKHHDSDAVLTAEEIQTSYRETKSEYTDIRTDSKALSSMNIMEMLQPDGACRTNLSSAKKITIKILDYVRDKMASSLAVEDRMPLAIAEKLLKPIMAYLVAQVPTRRSDTVFKVLGLTKIRQVLTNKSYKKMLEQCMRQEPPLSRASKTFITRELKSIPAEPSADVDFGLHRETPAEPIVAPSRPSVVQAPTASVVTGSGMFSRPSRAGVEHVDVRIKEPLHSLADDQREDDTFPQIR